jgi:hypothetical protein
LKKYLDPNYTPVAALSGNGHSKVNGNGKAKAGAAAKSGAKKK